MKTRIGFVSNSSSASFVLIGLDVTGRSIRNIIKAFLSEEKLQERLEYYNTRYNKIHKKDAYSDIDSMIDDMYWELIDEANYVLMKHEEHGAPKGRTIVGTYLVDIHSDDPYLSNDTIEFSELEDIKSDLMGKFGADNEFKIYYGTRMV